MGIDDLIRMSRAEDLDVDEMDMEYGYDPEGAGQEVGYAQS